MLRRSWFLAGRLSLAACTADDQTGQDQGASEHGLAGNVTFRTCEVVQEDTIRFPVTGIEVQSAYRAISIDTKGPSLVFGPEDVTYTIEGPDAAEFEHVPNFSWCSFADPGPEGNASSCAVVLAFRPTTRGQKHATLRVSTPFTDPMTGTMVMYDDTFPIEAIAVSAPTVLYASSTRLYVAADPHITLTNGAAFPLSIGGTGIQDGWDRGFALQGSDCPEPLEPGASCIVSFWPQLGTQCATGTFATGSGLILPLETGAP
jgi:hypothetical protein